jgi:hypothetical protein
MYNESQFVALYFFFTCAIAVFLFFIFEADVMSLFTPEPEPPKSWFPILQSQKISKPEHRLLRVKKSVDVDVLDRLPLVVALPFRITDTIWETSVTVTAISIKTLFYPQILTYRLLRRAL